jgi:hypothetical protein
MGVLVLILLIPLGSIALSYRAHREAERLREDVRALSAELAYWRETGGRLMEGLVRDKGPSPAAGKRRAPPTTDGG